jgi:hypothetical protein
MQSAGLRREMRQWKLAAGNCSKKHLLTPGEQQAKERAGNKSRFVAGTRVPLFAEAKLV